MKELARKSALSYKAKDKSISIIEDFSFDAPKTQEYAKMLTALALDNKKTLLVLADNNKSVALSGRNIQNTKVVMADMLTTYDVLNADNLILSEGSIEKIDNLLKK